MKLKTSRIKQVAKAFSIKKTKRGMFQLYENDITLSAYTTYEEARQALIYRLAPLLEFEED